MKLLALLLAAASVSPSLAEKEKARDIQIVFKTADSEDFEWDKAPHPDATGHLIFNSVADALQLWPNSLHRNGHSMILSTIAPGTVLYHGRSNTTYPSQPDWLAFDFEHAYLFARGNSGHVFTFMVNRPLKLVYIDGAGAAKMDGGSMDSQDIISWRGVCPDRTWDEHKRIRAMCEWAKTVGVDGFIRQEFHFEVMQCDFSESLDLVSSIAVLPSNPNGPGRKVHAANVSADEQELGDEHRRPPRRPAHDFATNDEHRPHFDEGRTHLHNGGERPHHHGEHRRPEDDARPFGMQAHGEPDSRRPPPPPPLFVKGFSTPSPQDGYFDSDGPRYPPARHDGPSPPPPNAFDGPHHVPHSKPDMPPPTGFDGPRHPHAPPPPPGVRPHHFEYDGPRAPKDIKLASAQEQRHRGRLTLQDDERPRRQEHHDKMHGKDGRPMKDTQRGPGLHAMDEHPAPLTGDRPRLPKGDCSHPPPTKDDHSYQPPLSKGDYSPPPPKDDHLPPPPKGPKFPPHPPHHGFEPFPPPPGDDKETSDIPSSDGETPVDVLSDDAPVPLPTEDDKPPSGPWPPGPGGPGRGPGGPGRGPGREPAEPPVGWKGSLPAAGFEQAAVAGKWHDRAPGETRARIDWTGFVSFYDPALTSLVEARRGVPRLQHRLLNISAADVEAKMTELEMIATRDPLARPSNVDWSSVTRVVVERYSSRLERLARTLEKDSKAAAVSARNQILIMLAPYLSRESVRPDDGSKAYLAPIVHRCASTATEHIPTSLLTPQERLIHASVAETLHEVCRRLARMWDVAFDLEEAEADAIDAALKFMHTETSELMSWLDWSVWVRCSPACSEDELCHIPMWPFGGDDPYDMTPHCKPYPTV